MVAVAKALPLPLRRQLAGHAASPPVPPVELRPLRLRLALLLRWTRGLWQQRRRRLRHWWRQHPRAMRTAAMAPAGSRQLAD